MLVAEKGKVMSKKVITERLRKQCIQQLNQYDAALIEGEEPPFPQWAADTLYLLERQGVSDHLLHLVKETSNYVRPLLQNKAPVTLDYHATFLLKRVHARLTREMPKLK